MAMMERLLLQVLGRKKSIVDQVNHQTRLFDQHLASTLLIDGIEPPEWLLRSHPTAAEYKRDEVILDPFQRPSQFPNSSCCGYVHEEALVNTDQQCMVASCDDLGSMMDTCNGCRELSVLPEDTANCASDEPNGPKGTEFMVLSPDIQNMAGTGKSHHDFELSLASIQRSKTRQRALKLRNSASQSCRHAEINENFEGNKIASTFGIVKCCADAQLDQAEDKKEVPVITSERIPICEMPSERKIYVHEPSCTLEESTDIHAEVKGVIEENVRDAGIKDVRSNDCSKKVLISQNSTCFSDVDSVIKFDDSFYCERSKPYNEYTPQITPADEKCGVDQTDNEVCQENGHESATGSLKDSKRFSCVADSNKFVDMDNSSNTSELLVKGSVDQVSKTSKPLVGLGYQSVETRSKALSPHVSASDENKWNVHGCDAGLEIYVGDSGGGSLPSMNPTNVVSLGKLEMDPDHLTDKDMEVLVPGSISQLKFDDLGETMLSLNVASPMISEKAIHSSSLLKQTLLKHQDHKDDEKFRQVYPEDGLNGTIQPDTLHGLIVDSSCSRKLEEQCGNPASDGVVSPDLVVGSLSINRFDDGKKTSFEEQEQPFGEEQKQRNHLCSEEGHDTNIELVLQERNILLHRMIGSSSSQFSDLAVDQNKPVLEGFVISTGDDQSCFSEDGLTFKMQAAENATMRCGRILELLGKSTSFNTPLQQLFIGNTDNKVSRLHQSVPNGLLEHVDLKSSLSLKDGEQVGCAVDVSSHSDCLPYGEVESTRNNRKPYASPVGKLWEIVHANSGSSKHKGSLIPELPCISEEIELADETVDGFNEVFSVGMAGVKREPVADVIEDPNLTMFNDDNESARCSLDSTMIEATFSTANERLREKHKNQDIRKGDVARSTKNSKTFERVPNGVKRAVKSSKYKKDHPKNCLEDGGSGISRKKSKLNNIVSSVASFLPFVQQKQVTTPCAGKRNIKVKALEAAEAAKRQAEKKEIERKLKKEALKLERERLEKENMIRLEVEKKRKDEERKKKEAEMALKKRLREEEDKREKENKRRHIKETLKNVVDRQETSCSDKEFSETKDLDRDAILTEKKVFQVDSGKQVVDKKDRLVSNLKDLSQTTFGLVGREMLTREHYLSEDDGILEPSYDISPYKCSDDEDEEEEEDDDLPDDKFIPSWARKGSIAKYVFSQQNLDPDVIFPPDSFCSISEVVLPLKYQLKLLAGASQ